MKYFSKKITNWLYKTGSITYDEIELYQYSCNCIVQLAIPLAVFLLICLSINRLLVGLCLLTPFLTIRKYSGGYHAPNFEKCFIYSDTIFVSLLILSYFHIPNTVLVCMLIAATIMLAAFSPIDSKINPLSNQEKSFYRKKTIFLCTIWIAIIIITIYFNKLYSKSLIYSYFLAAVSQIPCLIKTAK